MDKIAIDKNQCNYVDIARVIGIYLVVLGHMPIYKQDSLISSILYSFHMPLFFIISGMLHKDVAYSFEAIKKIFISLIIPYIIYNILSAIINYPVSDKSPSQIIIGMLECVGEQSSGASWFFLALFYVKIISLFLKNSYWYIILSLLCVIFLLELQKYNIAFHYKIMFRVTSGIAAFPFFAFGYLMKNYFDIKRKSYIKLAIIFVCVICTMSYAVRYDSVWLNIGLKFVNVYIYLVGISGSVVVLYFSQYLLPFLKSEFIKTISRGTMIIVGLHQIFTLYFVRNYPDLSPLYSILISLVIVILFYFIIKLTYGKIPILYGKQKNV